MKRLSILILLLMAITAVTPVIAQEAPTANLTDGCVENYDPTVDYFPEKATFEYAEQVTVEYFNNYKVVHLATPWVGATEADAWTYVLVQCGTPAPEGFEDATIIEVPAGNVIAMSTTYLPHLEELGLLDRLVGIDSFLYTSTPEVQEMIASDQLIEVGSGSAVNVELVIDAEPDIVMTYGSGLPEYDAHPVLIEAGIPVVLNAEFLENSPLGRAEWIKYTSLFYNAETAANAYFEEVAAQYQALLTLTEGLSEAEKPLVLPNAYTSYDNAWNISGETSYAGQLIRDAGGAMVLGDDASVQDVANIVPFSFEAVYEAGLDADIWLPNLFMTPTRDDLLAQDERYADFAAFENGTIYNNDARVNENGGNDYYESGVIHPELILADLIFIFHPDLLPDHELVYFRPLP